MVTKTNCNDYNNKSTLTNEFKKGLTKSNSVFNPTIASPYGSSFRKGSFAASFGGDTYRNSFGASSDLESTTISHSESISESVGSSTGSSIILDSKMPTTQSNGSKPHIKTISTRQSNNSNTLKSTGSVMNSIKPQLGCNSALASTSSRNSSGMGSSTSSGPSTQSSFPTNSVSASGYVSSSGSGYNSGSGYVSTCSASGSASSYTSVSATIPGAAPMKPQSSVSSSNCTSSNVSNTAVVSNSAVASASGSTRHSVVSSAPVNATTTLRQQSVMGSGLLNQSGGCGSVLVSARPSAISTKSITSNISKTASAYKYDCSQVNSSEPMNISSALGKSPSIVSKRSEAKNCGSVALPIFETPIADPKGCTASKTSLSGKSVTLNLDSRRSSKRSNKLGSCTSLAKSAFGSVKKTQSSTTLVSNASTCKSNKSTTSKKGDNKNGFISEVENAILRSTDKPIEIKETEEIKALGNRGIWANKSEVMNWKGPIPICKYPINEDEEPQIIYKRVKKQLEYVQEMTIRYLRPPTPPEPGEIVIKLEPNKLTPPAPPIVIRQQPPKPVTPEPLIIREAPPPAPPCVAQYVTIYGQRLPPPPRKVVIERLAPLPNKPQSVLIERWLPYTQLKRRVIFQGAPPDPVVIKPKNIVVQWETPNVIVRREHKHLGVIRANPSEYVQRYQNTLKAPKDLPQFVLDIKTPEGLVLAADQTNNNCGVIHELEGDLEALKLVDLDREGLGEYKSYLQKLGSCQNINNNVSNNLNSNSSNNIINNSSNNINNISVPVSRTSTRTSIRGSLTRNSASKTSLFRESSSSFSANKSSSSFGTPKPSILKNSNSVTSFAILSFEDVFKTLNTDAQGTINLDEAARELMKINSRLGKYDDDELRSFITRFRSFGINNDNRVSLKEFKNAFYTTF